MFLTEHTGFTERKYWFCFFRSAEKIKSIFFSVSSGELCERARKKSSFTLIELIVTVAVAGIAVLALVMVFQESLKSMERDRSLQSACLLSEDLMNEIRSKEYEDPLTPPAGETNRVKFDSVDDYTNWSESPPRTIEGIPLTNFSGFTWRAVVENVPATNFNSPAVTNDTYFKRITVVVSNSVITISNMSVVSSYDQ